MGTRMNEPDPYSAAAALIAKHRGVLTFPARLRVTADLAARIDAAAEAEGVNRSEMIRRALEERF